MLNKLKNALENIRDDENETSKKKVDISVLNAQEVKIYKKLLEDFKENIEVIEDISRSNRQEILDYIKQKKEVPKGKGSQNKEDHYSFEDDINEIKDTLKEVLTQVKQIQTIELQMKAKVDAIQRSESTENVKDLQAAIAKYEAEIKNLTKGEQNNREILSTLKQQSQLYIKETKDLQEKTGKMEKELHEKNTIIKNLREEKTVLLEMRNADSKAQIPEVEALKRKIAEMDKRMTLEKTKLEQKEKEIDGLRKKMEEDRESLEKIADELKEKELKSKKVVDKYERSKTEIRKFREEKTEFIKKLNIEVADLNEQLQKQVEAHNAAKVEIQSLREQVEELSSEVSKNQNQKIELISLNEEMGQMRKELYDKDVLLEDNKKEYMKLKEIHDQLQGKRKQLLQALEKPVAHEIRTLQKIIKALEKLYKEYITTVFQEGNIVGFESKITYILSNVQDIKEDLLL